jgi:hypothetical protein
LIISLLNNFTSEIRMLMAAVSFVLALFQIFGGYKMLRGWISAGAFLIGLACGFALTASVSPNAALWIRILVGLIIGTFFGWAAWKIYLIAVFVYCGAFGAALVSDLPFPETQVWSVVSIIICVAAFAVVGFLSVRFSRPTIIIATAVGGAGTAVNAMAVLGIEIASTEAGRVFCFIIFVVAGLVVQFLTTGGIREKRRRRR